MERPAGSTPADSSAGESVREGERVQLVGLTKSANLNGQLGVVLPRTQWPEGRIAVQIGPADKEDGAAQNEGGPVSGESDQDEEDDGEGLNMVTEAMIMTEPERLKIYRNTKRNYYVSLAWDPAFYIDLAWCGFVSVAHEYKEGLSKGRALLLPEMQKAYGFIDLEADPPTHASKKVRKRCRQKNYSLGVNQDLTAVVRGLKSHHENNWFCNQYLELWRHLSTIGPIPVRVNGGASRFHALSIELIAEDGEVVAGEVGYILGRTYTSLTGYFSTESECAAVPSSNQENVTGTTEGEDCVPPGGISADHPPSFPEGPAVESPKPKLKHTSAGKIQLVALSKLLKKSGVRVWNLGHPPKMPTEEDPKGSMVYKSEIGGVILSREEFLVKWSGARDQELPGHTLPSGRFCARKLILS